MSSTKKKKSKRTGTSLLINLMKKMAQQGGGDHVENSNSVFYYLLSEIHELLTILRTLRYQEYVHVIPEICEISNFFNLQDYLVPESAFGAYNARPEKLKKKERQFIRKKRDLTREIEQFLVSREDLQQGYAGEVSTESKTIQSIQNVLINIDNRNVTTDYSTESFTSSSPDQE